MITVEFKDGSKLVWHHGEAIPSAGQEVIRLDADGDELTWIRFHLSNIPCANGLTVTWFGEMARFIWANL